MFDIFICLFVFFEQSCLTFNALYAFNYPLTRLTVTLMRKVESREFPGGNIPVSIIRCTPSSRFQKNSKVWLALDVALIDSLVCLFPSISPLQDGLLTGACDKLCLVFHLKQLSLY